MPDLNEMKEIDEVEFDVYDSDTGKDLTGFGADSANNLKVRDLWNEYPDRADNGIFALTPLDEERSNAVVQAVKDFSAGFAGNVSQGVLTLPKNMEATGLGLLEETTKAITPMVNNSPIWKTVSKEIFDIDINSKEYKETVDTFNKVFSEKIKEEQHNLYLQNQEISKDINEAFGLTGEGFFEKLGGATGSLFTAIGINFIGSTPAVLGYFGASSGTDAFQTAREKGKSNWEALGRGLAVGSWEAFSEKIGLDLFIGGLAKKGAKAFLFGMVDEGTQEAVQNIGSDFLMKDITGKKWSEILYDALESGFYAMLTGGLLGGIGRVREGKVRETIKQGYIKAGLSDEQATKFTDKLIEYGSNNENMTDLMKKTINEQLDIDKYPSGDHKEAVKRATEYRDRYLAENQYDYDIRDRVKENITGLDEKNKNQVADFVQSFAESTYEDFGIAPAQMLEDTGLKVQNESLNLADENTYFNANGELVDKATGQVLFQKEQDNRYGFQKRLSKEKNTLEENIKGWEEYIEKQKNNVDDKYNTKEDNIKQAKKQIQKNKKRLKEIEAEYNEPVSQKLYATHNMNLAGVQESLNLGGFAMPSLALRNTAQGKINEFGDIVFVGDKNLSTPSRSTEVYDRDAWTPNLYDNIVYEFNKSGYDYIKSVIEKAKAEGQNVDNGYSVYAYNISQDINNPYNTMAMSLYELVKNKAYKYSELKDNPEYLNWYQENIKNNATPYLYTENDSNTDMVMKKLTLENMMKVLKKKENAGGGYLGDFIFSVDKILNFMYYKFSDLKEIKKNIGKIKTKEEADQYIKNLDNEFYNLADSLTLDKENYDGNEARMGIAVASINEESKIKENLDRYNLNSSEESINKIKEFRKKLQEAYTDYFEVKPRKIVKFGDFAGVIIPNDPSYNNVANRLEKEGLIVKRVEKTSQENYDEALNQIERESNKSVFFQKEQYNKPTININGVEKSALNSEGRPLGRTEEEIRNFYKWFGDSKVVDANGNPLVVYHGTDAEFEEFNKVERGVGYWFGTKQNAEYYARDRSEKSGKKERIYPVYLKLEKIADISTEKGREELKGFSSEFNDKELWNFARIPEGNISAFVLGNEDFAIFLSEKGYDGIKFDGAYISFSRGNIKSVDNKGTYNPDTGNIYYQKETPSINLNISDNIQERINKLEEERKAGAGDNLEDTDILENYAREQAKEQIKRDINSMDADEFMEQYYNGEEISEQETPYEDKEKALQYLKDEVINTNLDNLVSDYISGMDSYNWDNIREEYKNTTNRYNFFDDYQTLVGDIMEENGFYVDYDSSDVSDSKYIDVYKSEEDYDNNEEPFAKIRISDHDTHKYWGDNIKIYTYKDVNSQIQGLIEAFKNGDFGIDDSVYLQEGEQNIRGMFDMTKASERIVSVMKSGDVDTMMHELSHFFTTYRIELAIKNNKLDLLEPLFKEYNLEVNVENAKRLQTEFQEDIATKAVNYFLDGKAPTVGLRKYFGQMKKWAMNMWDSLVDKGLVNREEISENMQDFFDGMFGTRAMALDLQGIRQNKSGIKKLLNDIKNGREINFNSEEYGNINIDEVYNLIKTKNARIPKMPKNLKQALISAGGIDINLANNLDLINLMGMQDEKNQKLFVKNGAIKDETQLIEWLKSNGFMAQKESLSYDDTANDQDMALNLLENSDNVYSENDAAQLTYRERVLEAAEEAEKILDGLDYYEAVQALSELKGKNQTVIDKMASKKLAGKLKEFEKQYKKYAKDLATATKSEIQGIRNNIVDFINSQNIDGNDKAKLLSEIKKANSPLTLQKTMERIKQRAETYYTQEQVRLLSAIVDKEIKKSRPVDAKHQRYDYENNKLFQALREDSKLTQKEAEMKWNDLMAEEGEISKSKEIEKLYLAYQMNGAKTSPQLLNMLVDKIQEAKQAGRMAKDELDFERKLNIKQNKEEVLAGIKSRKVANKFTVGISRGIDNLYSMLNLVAGKNTADKFQMETTEEKMAIHKNKILNSSLDTARKIYGLKTKGEFLNKVGELRTVIGQLYTREDSNVGKLSYDITKMHIIDLYNAAQNSKSLNDLEYYYGKEQLQGLFSLLTTQDIQFAESMRETVDGLYPEINEVYIQQYGTDLNRVENYWMASTEHKKEAELLSSFTKAKNTPSFYEKRTNTRTLIVPTDAYSKFNRHITGACYMIDMARPWKSLRDTFNSVRVKNAIQNKFGKGAWNSLDKHINDLSFGEMMRGAQSDEISSILNTMQNNFVTAKIAIAPSVFVKQLTSVTNYAENMGYGKWGIDFVKGLSHPKETLDYMNKYVGDFLKNRFQTGYDEAMKRVLQEAKQKRYQVLTDGAKNNYTEFLSLFTRSGDLMAIAYGGYPRLKQLVDSGMPIEKVREQFMLETLQGQQSGNTSSLSNMQKNRSVFLRVMYSFKNTPMQYARKINDSIISCLNGDISVKEASRKLFNYAVIQPTLYVLVGNIIYNLFSPDDKDKELTDGILQEMAMQFVNPIPLLDKLVDYGFKKMAGQYTDTQLMIYSDFKKAIDKMGKKQKNTYDYLEILVPFIEGFTALPAGRAVKNLKTLAEWK